MKEKYGSNFLIGLLFGSLVVLLFWYYQKSTSAEDGALALLDRLAEAQARLRALQEESRAGGTRTTAVSVPPATQPQTQDDLTRVKGIGPVFASRLQAADITTITQLASLPVAQVMEILQIPEWRAVDILAAAQAALV
ncbi:MAG: hypothetical protein Kow0080_09950 [Candidatus Promineifilaceae bacterium]